MPPARRPLTLLIAGIFCIAISSLTALQNKNQAHADFLNSDSTYLLSPTNVGMTARWSSGMSHSTAVWSPAKNATSYNLYLYDTVIAKGLTGSSYSIDPTLFNSSATYTMTSVDANGNESLPSNLVDPVGAFDPSGPIQSWTATGPLPVPGNVRATAQWNLGRPRAFLVWSGTGISETYNVYRDGTLIAHGMTSQTFIDDTIQPGSSHQYSVSSVNTVPPSMPESSQSAPVSLIALTAAPTFSATPVTITKVVPNDDSVNVFFDAVPGAVDYRVYSLSNTASVKYGGDLVYVTDPKGYWSGIAAAPFTYSIEMNGLPPSGADLIVEAVDKLGPFQKMDGFAGPGASFGTSINGQGDPTNVPNVIARSRPFHVTMKPFQLTGSQVFQDTFRNEQPLTTAPVDPAITDNNYGASDLVVQKNNKWTITGYSTDTLMTRNFFMGSHFMDTLYDGPAYTSAFSHNNNATDVVAPNATADISGGKVLHVTMEVDAHDDGRRWTDIMVGPAGEALRDPQSPGKLSIGGNPLPTTSGNLLYWGILDGNDELILYKPDPNNPGHSVQTDLMQLTNTDDAGAVRDPQDAQLGINGSPQDLDKRHRFDLYLSQTHYKIVETAPDGTQIVREKDLPLGVSIPFTNMQTYYNHELYHTSNDRHELPIYSAQAGSNANGDSAQYWYNYRPYSDERHWDNMGFEVLPSVASIPPASSLIPESETINFTTPTASPTPTPSPSPFVALTYDLNKDGLVDLHDIVLAISYFTGRTPNAQALILWPPAGNPKLAGIIQVINACHVLGSCR